MKIQLTTEQLGKLMDDSPGFEAELASGVQANYAQKIASRIATRLIHTAMVPSAQAIEDAVIGKRSWQAMTLDERWTKAIKAEGAVTAAIRRAVNEDEIVTVIKAKVQKMAEDAAYSAIRSSDIGKRIDAEITSKISSKLNITVKTTG